MVNIEDLVGIPEQKRIEITSCLDELMTIRDSNDNPTPIISGYNWYNRLSEFDRIITLSNIHKTEDYKRNMLKDLSDLGYVQEEILKIIRDKGAALFWHPKYRIRNSRGKVLPGLRIKDVRTGKYVALASFRNSLLERPQFAGAIGYLIAEDHGWELNMPFRSKDELMRLVELFLKKSGKAIFDESGSQIQETEEERRIRLPWADAYETPVLIIGRSAMSYLPDLRHFGPVTRFGLIEDGCEISFIINKRLESLRQHPNFKKLTMLGFFEEQCLANKPFILDLDGFSVR